MALFILAASAIMIVLGTGYHFSGLAAKDRTAIKAYIGARIIMCLAFFLIVVDPDMPAASMLVCVYVFLDLAVLFQARADLKLRYAIALAALMVVSALVSTILDADFFSEYMLYAQGLWLVAIFPATVVIIRLSFRILRGRHTQVTLDETDFRKQAELVVAALKSQVQPLALLIIHSENLSADGGELTTRIVRDALRSGDFFGLREDGSLMIMLPRVMPATGVSVADRISAQLKNLSEGTPVTAGVSGGVPAEDHTLDNFLSSAEKALAEAVALGGNKTVAIPL